MNDLRQKQKQRISKLWFKTRYKNNNPQDETYEKGTLWLILQYTHYDPKSLNRCKLMPNMKDTTLRPNNVNQVSEFEYGS